MRSNPSRHIPLALDYVGSLKRKLRSIDTALQQAQKASGEEQAKAMSDAAAAARQVLGGAEELNGILRPYRRSDE